MVGESLAVIGQGGVRDAGGNPARARASGTPIAGLRVVGRWRGGRVGARAVMGVAAVSLLSILVIAGPAVAAEQPDGTASSGAVAGSDPSFLGLGPAGLLWALVGLLAVLAGLFLATRRVRKPIVDLTANTPPITSDDEPGGAR